MENDVINFWPCSVSYEYVQFRSTINTLYVLLWYNNGHWTFNCSMRCPVVTVRPHTYTLYILRTFTANMRDKIRRLLDGFSQFTQLFATCVCRFDSFFSFVHCFASENFYFQQIHILTQTKPNQTKSSGLLDTFQHRTQLQRLWCDNVFFVLFKKPNSRKPTFFSASLFSLFGGKNCQSQY